MRLQSLISHILYGELAKAKEQTNKRKVFEAPGKQEQKMKRKQLDISVEMGDDDDLEFVEAAGELKGIVKVAAGSINPFFTPGENGILSQSTFLEWQARFQKSIKSTGLWSAVQNKL